MKFKQLTKKILYEASQEDNNDKLESFASCYENVKKENVDKCMQKWGKVYQWYGGSEMLESFVSNAEKQANTNKKPL